MAARSAAAWLAPVPCLVEGLLDLREVSWVTATSDSFHMSRLGLRTCLLASWRWLGIAFGGGSGGSCVDGGARLGPVFNDCVADEREWAGGTDGDGVMLVWGTVDLEARRLCGAGG